MIVKWTKRVQAPWTEYVGYFVSNEILRLVCRVHIVKFTELKKYTKYKLLTVNKIQGYKDSYS